MLRPCHIEMIISALVVEIQNMTDSMVQNVRETVMITTTNLANSEAREATLEAAIIEAASVAVVVPDADAGMIASSTQTEAENETGSLHQPEDTVDLEVPNVINMQGGEMPDRIVLQDAPRSPMLPALLRYPTIVLRQRVEKMNSDEISDQNRQTKSHRRILHTLALLWPLRPYQDHLQ